MPFVQFYLKAYITQLVLNLYNYYFWTTVLQNDQRSTIVLSGDLG